MCVDFILCSQSGGLVEHVFKIKYGEGSCFFGRGKVLFNLELGGMNNEVNAAFDGDAELTKGEKEFGYVRGKSENDVFAHKPSPS